MKDFFRQVFWFVLCHFEKGEGPYSYKPSNRSITIAVGILFGGLSGGNLYFSLQKADASNALTVVVFFVVAAVALIIGLLGSDRAVANLWGSGNKGNNH